MICVHYCPLYETERDSQTYHGSSSSSYYYYGCVFVSLVYFKYTCTYNIYIYIIYIYTYIYILIFVQDMYIFPHWLTSGLYVLSTTQKGTCSQKKAHIYLT